MITSGTRIERRFRDVPDLVAIYTAGPRVLKQYREAAETGSRGTSDAPTPP